MEEDNGTSRTSSIPKRLADYREQEYWENRYKNEKGQSYDWLLKYPNIKTLLNPLIKPHDRILVLGCGNSSTPIIHNHYVIIII